MEPLYKPEGVEARWQRTWEEEGLYHAEPDSSRESYVICVPPPNVTGALHMGHALNGSLQDALSEIAGRALKRETGARGLRSIIETALLDVMFELPSRKDVSKCVITKETIVKGLKPTLVTSAGPATLDEPEELAEESA